MDQYVRVSIRARKGSHSRAHFCFTPALLRSYHGGDLILRKEDQDPGNSHFSMVVICGCPLLGSMDIRTYLLLGTMV